MFASDQERSIGLALGSLIQAIAAELGVVMLVSELIVELAMGVYPRMTGGTMRSRPIPSGL